MKKLAPIWVCRICGKRCFRFDGGAVFYQYKTCTAWTDHIESHYSWFKIQTGKTWTTFQRFYKAENIKYMHNLDFSH